DHAPPPAARRRLPSRRRARRLRPDRRFGAGHDPHRHDRRRHPADARPTGPGLRGQPLHRHPALRRADRLGPVGRRQALRGDPRPVHRVAGGRGGQDALGVPPAAGREVPRRQRLQRRRRGVERPQGAGPRGAALRPAAGGPHRLADADSAARGEGGRPDGGARHQRAGQPAADQPDQPVHGEPHALGRPAPRRAERRGRVERLRRQPLRHRPVPPDALRSPAAGGDGAQRRLLGREGQGRSRPPDPDPGSERAHRRAALGPSGLDRGAVTGRRAAAPLAQHDDHPEPATARLAVAALLRGRQPPERRAGAPRAEPGDRPRRAEAAPRRLHGGARGILPARPSVVGQPVLPDPHGQGRGAAAAGRGGLRAAAAAQPQG
ncbi:MAG: ABC transporter, substrate-binding protein (cluster 5, nickel/peptides/opines), partial [uncultured Acetobacteraceae bacterium]